jgi:peptidyl-prolyl isomerase H (cyclophilin H)
MSLNPITFFDISIAGQPAGRLKFELFADITPRTAENFRQFCTGEYKLQGQPQGYKHCLFHRLIKGFIIQGGDFVFKNGTGTRCIYGTDHFPDENFHLQHSSAGLLSMANTGADTNGCQLFITLGKCEALDRKHVVFGRVVDGLHVLEKMQMVPVDANNRPKITVEISECGQM